MKSAAVDPALLAAPDYREFIAGLKNRITAAQLSAARSVNRDLILLYWDIGRGIVEKQRLLGWGEAVVEMVAADLRQAFPGMKGFSPRNVWYMRRLFEVYGANDFLQQLAAELRKTPPGPAIWPQPVAKSDASSDSSPILQQPVAELATDEKRRQPVAKLTEAEAIAFLPQLVAGIPWGHHLLLFDKVTDPAARLYYLRATARFGWSRNVLLNQIKAGAYERAVTEKKTHNFPLALPEHLAEQADEMLKSSYNLEFLGLRRAVRERFMPDQFWLQLQKKWSNLPQRGCISQPRVAARPLPWVTETQAFNPNGVASKRESHATIVVVRAHSFGVFHQGPRAVFAGCDHQARNARLRGWLNYFAARPKVAALPQPWAERQNPVGILPTARQLAGIVRAELEEGK